MGMHRTFKEITAVVSDATDKDIRRCFKLIVNQLGVKMDLVNPADYVRRFCSQLGLSQRDIKAAEEMAEAAVPRDPVSRCDFP
jgi:transcription initiation factor TFIIB